MASTKEGRPERKDTDESLRVERDKTDEELERNRDTSEETANAAVAQARERADAVVELARTRADRQLSGSGATSEERQTVNRERREADDTLAEERGAADEDLSSEREAGRKALAALLASERERTDEYLGRERMVADVAIASRDEFLAIASHDLRNMLGGMALHAAALINIRCEPIVHDAIVRDARRIQRYTAQMARLVGDLVDVVSIEAGRLAVTPTRHDAVELVRETLEVFQPVASAKQIWIGTDVKGGTLLARYDHQRILQVLANLVGNALKFTPDGGRVHIGVEPDGADVRFAVADTGPGVPPDKVGLIFDRFWQVATKRPSSGLGLGLYISKCIVEAHGGRIWAESRVREGSTFYFTLPAADPSSTREP